jgi:protein-tyrosine phosphatase
MPRPRGGDWLEDEVRAWRDAGVDLVVSLLEESEVTDLDLAAEEELAHANNVEFVSFPLVDRGIPESGDTVWELATKLALGLSQGTNVAIHCRQGIGRAALVVIATMLRLGVDAEAAMERVSKARGRVVPETTDQREWLVEFARKYAKTPPA